MLYRHLTLHGYYIGLGFLALVICLQLAMVGIAFFLKKPSIAKKNIIVLFVNLLSLSVVKIFSLTAFDFSSTALTPFLLFIVTLFRLKKGGTTDGESGAEKTLKLNVIFMLALICFFATIMMFEKNLVLPLAGSGNVNLQEKAREAKR
jgi:hypothetical protein